MPCWSCLVDQQKPGILRVSWVSLGVLIKHTTSIYMFHLENVLGRLLEFDWHFEVNFIVTRDLAEMDKDVPKSNWCRKLYN